MADPNEFSDRLMIDPSLLLDSSGISALREARETSATAFLIPTNLHGALLQGGEGFEGWEQVWEEYAPGITDLAPIEDVRSLVLSEVVHPFGPPEFALDDPVYGRLLETARGQRFLADVWYLEWVYLNTESWIAAVAKRTFETFKQAGAIAVEFPRDAFDAVARRTPHVVPAGPPSALTTTQRLRATTKWVATGGPPWAFLLNPILGAVAVTVAGAFLLFDP